MVRLRIALGVASSLVAIAALTIVFAGTGQAQGNGNGPSVFVTNTPLPVTGNLTATIPGTVNVTGNVNAAVTGDVNAAVTGQVTVNNPSNNPVLIRDVDAQGAKELWQTNKVVTIADGVFNVDIVFDPVPAGKALVIEHVNFLFQNPSNLAQGVVYFGMNNTSSFSVPAPSDIQYFVPHQGVAGFYADVATKFYVGPGNSLRAFMPRLGSTGQASGVVTVTGYLVDHP